MMPEFRTRTQGNSRGTQGDRYLLELRGNSEGNSEGQVP